VVLALEVGSEDDPPELPGLVHALAYQLEQGNRELRPAEAIATAQDAGGVYSLATGVAQVRFESLIPASRLDPMLWVESQRLRAPTTASQRWAQSLGWAASDERGGSRLRPEALAFVHGAPGLGHDGRAVSKPLVRPLLGRAGGPPEPRSSTTPGRPWSSSVPSRRSGCSSGSHRCSPTCPRPRATRPSAASAPAPGPTGSGSPRGRRGSSRTDMSPGTGAAAPENLSPGTGAPAPENMSPGTGTAATAPLARQRGQTFVWPVPPSAAAGAWATALCRAINRQKKARRARGAAQGPAQLRLRGRRAPRRAHPAPERRRRSRRPSSSARLDRLAPGGPDAALLQAQAAVVAQALRLAVRTPAGLARQLAMSAVEVPPVGGGPSFKQQHRVDELTGLAALGDPSALERVAPGLLRVEDAVVLTFPEAQP
jgi:hypothetical protein